MANRVASSGHELRSRFFSCPGDAQGRSAGRTDCSQNQLARESAFTFYVLRFIPVDIRSTSDYQLLPARSKALPFMPTTEVILTEKIEHLGFEADVVKVKRGYARNFLVPRGKALEVTPATLKRLNLLKAKRAEREAKEMNEAEELARRINKLKLTLELETGATGKAFGSITAADIAEKLKSELGGKIELDGHWI